MLSNLLATKLHRPRPTSRLVARPRLTGRLDDSLRQGHRLILVAAPAGYGKTTLVTDWLGQTATPSAWLLLDEADNDPVRFFTYIVAALQALGLKVGQSLLDAFPTLPESPEALVRPLINDVAAANRSIILALDDYHLVTDGLIQEAMAFWLEHAPPNLHLVLLTRVDPPLPLPRLRVRELMMEIRDRDLRFTPEEMTAFLNSVHRLNLPAEQITALESRTEGWPAGVQLAALSLQGHSTERTAQFISAFSGSHHYVIDYLADEVLRRQTEEVQSFLLRTSVLDRLTGSLCDAVLGGLKDSDRMLMELERRNLFLIPLDDERQWYRYHHLFSDLLFQRLKQTQTEMVKELYARAAAWLEENGYLEDAVEYALKAQDYELAVRLMDQVRNSLYNRGEVRTLLSWLNTLPEELVRSQPDLSIFRAGCLVLIGCFDLAEEWLQLAEVGLGPVIASDRPAALRIQRILVYRSASARFHGDYAAAISLGQSGLDQTLRTEVRDRGTALLFLSHAHFYAGNTDTAEEVLADAIQTTLASGHSTAHLNACHHLAQLRVLQGRLHEARAIYEQATLFAGQQRPPVHAGTEHAGLGDLEREWNRLEAAAVEIQRGLELADAGDFIFFLTDVYLARVRLAMAQKDWGTAWTFIHKSGQVVRRCPTSIEIEILRTWQARLHLAQGNLAEAGQWAEAWQADMKGTEIVGPFDLHREFELLTLARIWLAQGKTDRAASLLERIRSAAEGSKRYGRAREAQMLQALVHQAAGDEARAVEEISRVLAQAEPEGYVRLFLDEGAPMARLLFKVSTRTTTDIGAYAARLLAACCQELADRPAPLAQALQGETLVEPLSERELEVLHLMAAGRSNREIAGELVITIGTAKRHTANIFDKLDVRNRTEAVTKARQLGLL
jgi:LuxR family transcriptional regulator, maltose regulon positive regulatory protein